MRLTGLRRRGRPTFDLRPLTSGEAEGFGLRAHSALDPGIGRRRNEDQRFFARIVPRQFFAPQWQG